MSTTDDLSVRQQVVSDVKTIFIQNEVFFPESAQAICDSFLKGDFDEEQFNDKLARALTAEMFKSELQKGYEDGQA